MIWPTDDIIAAPATPRGRSALAVIRCSGPRSIETMAKVFSRPVALEQSKGSQVFHGWILDETGNRIDEIMAAVFREPSSYTGQDSVEISCHGNPVVIDKIMECLRLSGFRDAHPGEFTYRAFFMGKMDMTRVEAVREIIDARTDRARALAVSRLAGAVENIVNAAKDSIKHQAAIAALALDYPEDEVEPVPFDYRAINESRHSLERLIATWRTGKIYQGGIQAAIVGPANAGKSTLFNLLLKEERSIVSDIPGTTRDWVEAWLNIKDIPLRLVDTAGLRPETDNPIELEGINRTRNLILASDIVIAVTDGAMGAKNARSLEEKLLNIPVAEDRLIRIWNKSDKFPIAPQGWIAFSAMTGTGLSNLENAILSIAAVEGTRVDMDAPIIDSMRQKDLLERAVRALLQFENAGDVTIDVKAEDLREALDALGELTGEVTRADVLNLMFGEFCVGK